MKKQENKVAGQYLQREIMFLQNEILPIVLKNTNFVHSEVGKYAIQCFETALKYSCNALLLYIPITDEYSDRPRVGIANSRDSLPFGTQGAMQIYCHDVEILNTDGNGTTENVECLTLSIHELL